MGRELLLANLLENDGEGVVGALEDRGVGDIVLGLAVSLEGLSSLESLGTSGLAVRLRVSLGFEDALILHSRELGVLPSSEEVELVPLGLSGSRREGETRAGTTEVKGQLLLYSSSCSRSEQIHRA